MYSKDLKRLQKAFDDTNNISNPFQAFGIGCEDNVLKAVIKSQNFEMFKMVIDQLLLEKKDTYNRVKLP